MPQQARLAALDAERTTLLAGGGAQGQAKQHGRGKRTARERLDLLLDRDSFLEIGLWARHRCPELTDKRLAADGVVTGKGEVEGRPVLVYAQDFTVGGGAVGARHADKIVELLQRALRLGMPVVGYNDSGGARIQEGVDALSGYGRIFYANTMLSGVVPQISVVSGPCAGGAAYSPALTDFVIMVAGSAHMFIAGPEVIHTATGEVVDAEALGGADAHASVAGNVHVVADSDDHAAELVRRLLSYLPSHNLDSPPARPFDEQVADDEMLDEFMPSEPHQSYDVRDVIHRLVDGGELFEIQQRFAPNIVVGFAHLGGMVVGLVANQPAVLAGALDIDASDKAARFIRTCNVYNIPLITLVDVPGFLPGVAQEHSGIIRHGAKMLFAYSSATVPKLTVILRKAYGGAYLAMCSKDLGADTVLAWPTAEIAVMGPEAAARVLHRLASSGGDGAESLAAMTAAYRHTHANPQRAAEALQVDDIVRPGWTRRMLIEWLSLASDKRVGRPPKRHGNIPL